MTDETPPRPPCQCAACTAYREHLAREDRPTFPLIPFLWGVGAVCALDTLWRLLVRALVALGFWPW